MAIAGKCCRNPNPTYYYRVILSIVIMDEIVEDDYYYDYHCASLYYYDGSYHGNVHYTTLWKLPLPLLLHLNNLFGIIIIFNSTTTKE
jgi:hypothetical protein